MECKIKSKIMGRTITFSRPGGSYVFMDTNNKEGCLGEQPTDNGSTLQYGGDDEQEFAHVCRLWYRRHIRAFRESYETADVHPDYISDPLWGFSWPDESAD